MSGRCQAEAKLVATNRVRPFEVEPGTDLGLEELRRNSDAPARVGSGASLTLV